MSTSPNNDQGAALPPPWPALASVLHGLRKRGEAERDAARALDLAGAAVRDLAITRLRPAPPAQIAVIGPTQAGKSTLVNVLLGEAAAGVSPLAGYTVHAEGFTAAAGVVGASWLAEAFPDAQRVPSAALQRDRYDQYSVTVLSGAGPVQLPAGAVVWDTPDFDSLAAEHYRRGVLGVAAIADVLVLVVSREKYADLSVWQLLALLAPLRRRLIVCLNKTTPEVTAVIAPAIRARLEALGLRDIPVLPLSHDPDIADLARGAADAAALQQAVAAAAAAPARPRPVDGARDLIGAWWQQWTAPLRAEHEALERWREAVQAGTASALEAYRANYLDDARRYDTFKRAVVELLVLLEPPALAGTLGRARRVLSWPARWLWGAARSRREAAPASEALVLDEALDHLLNGLAMHCARGAEPGRPDSAVWGDLQHRLASADGDIRAGFAAAVARHREAFEPEIQRAAGQLYARLKEHPRLLNSLRAARISADVAGVILAVKTGGVGMHDLLFAPAVISFTSTLTESALGAYMRQVADDLKRRQLDAVRDNVFGTAVTPALQSMAGRSEAPGYVTPEALQAADFALQRLAGG